MVKYMAWIERTNEAPSQEVLQTLAESAREQGIILGSGKAAWKRETGHGVEINTEFQPGYRPIWLWQA